MHYPWIPEVTRSREAAVDRKLLVWEMPPSTQGTLMQNPQKKVILHELFLARRDSRTRIAMRDTSLFYLLESVTK